MFPNKAQKKDCILDQGVVSAAHHVHHLPYQGAPDPGQPPVDVSLCPDIATPTVLTTPPEIGGQGG